MFGWVGHRLARPRTIDQAASTPSRQCEDGERPATIRVLVRPVHGSGKRGNGSRARRRGGAVDQVWLAGDYYAMGLEHGKALAAAGFAPPDASPARIGFAR